MGFQGYLSNNQKIGVGLSAAGSVSVILGCFLFFNRALLGLGNMLFLTGMILVIGPKKSGAFFFRRNKWRGSICFTLGLGLIILKYTIVGMCLEMFGFLNLFGDFFPYLLMFARRMPVLKWLLSAPIVSKACDRVCGTYLPV